MGPSHAGDQVRSDARIQQPIPCRDRRDAHVQRHTLGVSQAMLHIQGLQQEQRQPSSAAPGEQRALQPTLVGRLDAPGAANHGGRQPPRVPVPIICRAKPLAHRVTEQRVVDRLHQTGLEPRHAVPWPGGFDEQALLLQLGVPSAENLQDHFAGLRVHGPREAKIHHHPIRQRPWGILRTADCVQQLLVPPDEGILLDDALEDLAIKAAGCQSAEVPL
mmetsp:Transcript_1412/g.2551  ORF Transcript_1412/g.2551 Transcript_1412/m.2551 type:complete len:218 (+) Transcript_1412:1245-1898(+)